MAHDPKKKKKKKTTARKLTKRGLRGGGKFQTQREKDRERKGAERQLPIRKKKKKK